MLLLQNAEPPPPTSDPPVPRKRIFLLFLGLFVLLLGGTYAILDQAGAAHSFAQELLSRVLRTRFSLTNTGLDLAGGTVTLEGLRVARPGAAEEEAPMVQVDRVQVGVETNPLGDFVSVREVKITGWELNLSLVAGELPNLDELLALPGLEDTAGDSGSTSPPITITDSRIRLRLAPDQPALEFDDVQLELLPEAPGGSQLALRGELRSNAGFALQVQGTADLANNRFRALLTAENVPLDDGLVGRFQPELQQEFAAAGAQANLAKVSFWVEYGSDDPNAADDAETPFATGITADITDARCRFDAAPFPLENASGRISLTSRDGGSLRFALEEGDSERGRIHVRGELHDLEALALGEGLPSYEVETDITRLPLDARLRNALLANPETARVWDAFRPEAGQVDIHARVKSRGNEAPYLEADVTIVDVSATYFGFESRRRPRRVQFPLPMQNLNGNVQVRGGMIHLNRLETEIGVGDAAGSGVVIDGWIDTNRPDGGDELHLDILAERLAFDSHTRDALSALLTDPGEEPEGQRLFDEYNPQGFAAVSLQLRNEDNPADKGWRVILKPLGGRCSFQGFPLDVDDVRGTIRIDGHGVDLDLEAARDGSGVRVLGEVLYEDISDSNSGRIGLWVEADRIALDQDLRRALEVFRPQLIPGWDRLQPGGSTSATVALWRDPGEEDYTFDVQVGLTGARLAPPAVPVLVEDLYGPMLLHGKGNSLRLDMNGVSGRLYNGGDGNPADLYVVGALSAGGALGEPARVQQEAITAVIRNLALSERLAVTLDKGGVFPRDEWDLLEPSGTVDMVLSRTRQPQDDEPINQLDILLRDVRLDADALPGPATGLNGRIAVSDGSVRFRQLECEMLGARVAVDAGELRPLADGSELQATVSCPRFPVDDRLSSLLTGPFRDAYRSRNLSGDVEIRQLDVLLRFGPKSADGTSDLLSSSFSGSFAAQNLGFDLGTRIRDCNGRWRIDRAEFSPAGGRMEGALEDLSLWVLEHYCDQLRTRFVADSEGVVFQSLSAQAHGGRLTGVDSRPGAAAAGKPPERGALVYRYESPGYLQADLEMSGVDIRSLLQAAGSGADARVAGALSGQLTVQNLAGDDFVGMTAAGALELADADLGDVPLFTAFYSLMKPEQRPVFDGALIRVRVEDQAMRFEEFAVSSPLIGVDGAGYLGMDGYLDLEFRVPYLLGSAADIFIVPTTINALIEGAVRVHIHGYLRSLRAEVKSFLQGDPDRQPLLPVPPRTIPQPKITESR